MSALNFKARFVDAIKRGEKRCTIRAPRKCPVVAGETLYLYTGMRTANCRKLKMTVCRAVRSIHIAPVGKKSVAIYLDGKKIGPLAAQKLILSDGHLTSDEFRAFFEEMHGLPFTGQLIEW